MISRHGFLRFTRLTPRNKAQTTLQLRRNLSSPPRLEDGELKGMSRNPPKPNNICFPHIDPFPPSSSQLPFPLSQLRSEA